MTKQKYSSPETNCIALRLDEGIATSTRRPVIMGPTQLVDIEIIGGTLDDGGADW